MDIDEDYDTEQSDYGDIPIVGMFLGSNYLMHVCCIKHDVRLHAKIFLPCAHTHTHNARARVTCTIDFQH